MLSTVTSKATFDNIAIILSCFEGKEAFQLRQRVTGLSGRAASEERFEAWAQASVALDTRAMYEAALALKGGTVKREDRMEMLDFIPKVS